MTHFEAPRHTTLPDRDGLASEAPPTIDDPRIVQRLEEYMRGLEEGRTPDRERLLDRYPEIAVELNACLDALVLIHRVGPQLDQRASDVAEATCDDVRIQPPAALGDFRIRREIGRGGMGVVYEADQLSLGRQVALKVLPFAAVLDQRRLRRFQNEARAAAGLKHPNIVQVYCVGCERAVHFYAMEYVQGRTLAQTIEELRRLAGLVPGAADDASGASQPTGNSVPAGIDPLSQQSSGDASIADSGPTARLHNAPSAETACGPRQSVSSDGSVDTAEFFRNAANLGVQAADALEHAHQLGVVHRDVKPSNLMIDDGGHLWITDFGLAMTQTETNLTMTGDVLGTLRYMSPEQLQAKHGVLDHRTDIYSLGITLYELLTLRPAFGGDRRQNLVRRIDEEDPRLPRRINQAIPRDLETIVLKAIAKDPAARYVTAGELAEDLQRFLDNRPIRARRPWPAERLRKWSRRHRSVVYSMVAVLAMAAVGSSVGTALVARAYRAEVTQRARADANLSLAYNAMGSLLDRLEPAVRELARRNGLVEVGQLVDHAMELDERLPEEVRRSCEHRSRLASMHYQRGWGCAKLGRYETAERSLSAAIVLYEKLAAEDPDRYKLLLARCYYYLDDTLRGLKKFEAAGRARTRLRELAGINEGATLEGTPPQHGLERIRDERDYLDGETTEDVMEKQDKEIYHFRRKLVEAYDRRGDNYARSDDFDKAIVDYDKAVQLDPEFAEGYLDRGVAYYEKREIDRAIADLGEAIRLDSASSHSFSERGRVYYYQGEFEKATADYSKAIENHVRIHREADVPVRSAGVANRNLATKYMMRGKCYYRRQQIDKAVSDLSEAVRLNPNDTRAYFERGRVHVKAKRDSRAIADFNEAIRLEPKSAQSYLWRGFVRERGNNLDQAVIDFSEAIRLDSTLIVSYVGRGTSHIKAGRFRQAIDDFDEAIRRDAKFRTAFYQRGLAFCRSCDLDRAIDDLQKAVDLFPRSPPFHVGLGVAYGKRGEFDLAFSEFQEAIKLAPEDNHAFYHRGRIRASKGDYVQARHDFAEAVRLNDKSAGALLGMAEVSAKLGEMEVAQDHVKKAKSAIAFSLEAQLLVSWFLATCPCDPLRDPDRAVELATELVRRVPQSGAAWKILGAAQYRAGKYGAAQEALEKANGFPYHAVDFHCTNDPGQFFLAMAHWRQSQREEARYWYGKAVEWMEQNRPHNKELQRFRDEAAKVLELTPAETAGEETIP